MMDKNSLSENEEIVLADATVCQLSHWYYLASRMVGMPARKSFLGQPVSIRFLKHLYPKTR